ncbi:lipid A biosynthesis acyltransferase [Thiomicrospira aerophila AL3]|uniref:Lipid A biosynthesis acyltransferase n=1 Tax=Thiomicrospira aerophila AL3 TaxID=717772 RepID=W0DW31_9GAMM|nr:lysophospholipid acyltransferase family protein [Thiomicrospira aerophila]AHF01091.1 lipid A biosynthesis acyltransferase [Thiomicrospira aerophila AL3]
MTHVIELLRQFKAPPYWGIWLGVGLLWLLSKLPLKLRYRASEWLGIVLYALARSRRRLVLANLALAFPEKTPLERQAIAKAHFKSLGIQVFAEMTETWFGPYRSDQREDRLAVEFEGKEHLEAARAQNQGLIMLTPHFTHLEITGLLFSRLMHLHPIYRPHDHPLVDALILRGRTFQIGEHTTLPVSANDTRKMIKLLRQKQALGYLPDQRYRGKGHVTIPFFGQPAKSHTATSKLAALTQALVVPTFTERRFDPVRYPKQGWYYVVRFYPALDGFPSGDDAQDTQRLHTLYEHEIKKNPSQYLWVHNRWDLSKQQIAALLQRD